MTFSRALPASLLLTAALLLAAAPSVPAESAVPADPHAGHDGSGAAAKVSAGDPGRGQTFYQVCQTCHGPEGQGDPVQRAPQIAGQHEWYVVTQVSNFRAGVRGAHPQDTTGAQMRAMSMTLPNAQGVLDVAAYIQTFPDRRAPRTMQDGDVARGEELFRQCAVCHGVDARGNPVFGAPRLLGQADWYLLTQLQKLKAGIRGHHPDDDRGLQMSSVAQMLRDEADMKAVIAYLATLP